MAKLLFLIFVALASVTFALEEKTYNCDYQFGDPTWNFTKEYYNVDHTLLKGANHAEVILPADKGFMISFVCVNIPGVDKSKTEVTFSSLFHKLTIDLADKATKKIPYHVLAKRHGY